MRAFAPFSKTIRTVRVSSSRVDTENPSLRHDLLRQRFTSVLDERGSGTSSRNFSNCSMSLARKSSNGDPCLDRQLVLPVFVRYALEDFRVGQIHQEIRLELPRFLDTGSRYSSEVIKSTGRTISRPRCPSGMR